MKKKYINPSFRVVELSHKTYLLQASGKPPQEISEYDDWFGAKEETSDVDVWDEEW